jgi:hypothetical protein
MNTTAVKSAARNASRKSERELVKLLRRIGSTTVEITVHFSNTSKETMEDKLLRIMEREVSDRD